MNNIERFQSVARENGYCKADEYESGSVVWFTQMTPDAGRKNLKLPARSRLVVVPMLVAHAATHGHQGDNVIDMDTAPVGDLIAPPEAWCPNPGRTTCLTVRGASMAPLINEGDIVAVDCAQIDPNQLSGKIVVTWQPQRGLMLSRFLLVNGPQMLESENLAY